ncbi:MAG: DNA gyrase inhibitor YacG [Polyangiaceae bacterium]
MSPHFVMRIVCPICKTVIENAADDFAPRPFCSPQCKLVDLSNWMNEVYRVSEEVAVDPSSDPSLN